MSDINFKDALAIVEEIADEIFAEAEEVAEDSDHNPFKNFKKLGAKSPGHRKGPDQKGDWDCHKKGKYVQVCTGVGPDNEGQKKIVRIDPAYKMMYNKDYKAGVASGAYKPGARSSGGKKKTKKKSKK